VDVTAGASNVIPFTRQRLGEILVLRNQLTPGRLNAALVLQTRHPAPLGQLLHNRGWISQKALAEAISLQRGANVWTPGQIPADPRLIDEVAPETCLRWGCVPVRRVGGATLVASARPDRFERLRPKLEARLGPVRMAFCEEATVVDALHPSHRERLVTRAETRSPEDLSCRGFGPPARNTQVLAGLGILVTAIVAAPVAALLVATLIATLALVAMTALRLSAILAQILFAVRDRRTFHTRRGAIDLMHQPVVSVIVALFDEPDMVDDCLQRLSRLRYPKELTDVVLVVEDDDCATHAALSRLSRPDWVRVISVPRGTVRTKPRALNYALDHCRGSVIGVYDAEDAPEPDQLDEVVARFFARPADVACLQGRLDFYNPRQNWLSRCFALDYATWFRVLLPGLSRLGFAIPLGGTTVFFRREALEDLGAWDAHNVTEDADLGFRLARMGYRTELIDSTTFEEANCRPAAWVRQRSRWLKGYAMTYAVHMRRPGKLREDLGAQRFWGFQILMGGTLALYLLAPVLWSFLLLPLGLPHPLATVLGGPVLWALAGVFLFAELVSLTATLMAVSAPRRRWLMPWALTLQAYFALGAFAALRAGADLILRPFFWDKTAHGLSRHLNASGQAGFPRRP
jgi:cellulose synthase/poly-beta-1,6-N-acetylglucosamine synthase-like glycosyltransferase